MFVMPQIRQLIEEAIAHGTRDSVLIMHPGSYRTHLKDCYLSMRTNNPKIPELYVDEQCPPGALYAIDEQDLAEFHPEAKLVK